ncbi:MAG: hypothetical protein Q9165_008509 [Trypethelium subeluteriae]
MNNKIYTFHSIIKAVPSHLEDISILKVPKEEISTMLVPDHLIVHVRVRGTFQDEDLELPYNPDDTHEDTLAMIKQLHRTEGDLALYTECVRVTSTNWKTYYHPNSLLAAKPVASDTSASSTELPIVDNITDLLKQEAGKNVLLSGRRKREVLVTRKQPSKSNAGILARIPELLEFAGEYWHFRDASRATGLFYKSDKTVILDVGYAFRCDSYDFVLEFCIVQEAIFMDDVLSQSPSWQHCCPAYRVRHFADAEEAAANMLIDAMDHRISTIGSYVVLKKGTRINGLWCHESKDMTIGM